MRLATEDRGPPAGPEPLPRVSVLMPVWNPEPVYLELAVRSILEQSFTAFELIVTEDPGSRSAAPVLERIGSERIIYQRNTVRTCLIDQRNQGLRAARAPLVALMDSDDIAEPDRLARQVAFLEAHPDVDLVSSALTVIDADGRVVGTRRYPLEPEALAAAMKRSNPIAQPAIMFRKHVVEAVGGYTYKRYSVNSDYDLWCRLAAQGARFANLPECLVRYRIHPGGIKSSKLREVLAATVDIKRTHFKGQLTVGDQLRLAAESAMRLLPARLVLWLFMRLTYRRDD